MPSPTTKNSTPPPKPVFTLKQYAPLPEEAGGFFRLCIDDVPFCNCVFWAFSSCAVATLQGFKFYNYIRTPGKSGYTSGSEIFNNHAQEIITFLNTVKPDGSWAPKEYLMVLGGHQLVSLQAFLNCPEIKKIDDWDNKSHGGHVYLYRLSTQKDFK